MPTVNKVRLNQRELNVLTNELGDIVGIQGPTGAITFFPASVSQSGITASTASDNTALKLKYRNYKISIVGSAGDSLVLPAAEVGMRMTIYNGAAANAMDIFPAVGESINALTANTALSVVVNKTITFTCMATGVWTSNLTA